MHPFSFSETNTHHEFLSCSYGSLCSGCDWLLEPYREQRAKKIAHLKETWNKVILESSALPEPKWISAGLSSLRDRTDLMLDRRGRPKGKLGLFDRTRTGIVDLQGCPQLSPNLEHWLKEFRKVEIPIERGSIRLRVSPYGNRGVWLDLANIDVKRLLETRSSLDSLRNLAAVEIGQRRKRLVERNGELKLADPELEPWFETYIADQRGNETAVSLYCSIGSFTQPGFLSNRLLVREVREQVMASGAKRVAEFGSGIGNFTLPMASVCEHITAYEVDELALEGLRRSSQACGLESKITIQSGNFQIARADSRRAPIDFSSVDLVVVDPPRSGLLQFLDPLEVIEKNQRPRQFIYVSCFAESFVVDTGRLLRMGYQVEQLSIVDQFPQSRHYEVVATLSIR